MANDIGKLKEVTREEYKKVNEEARYFFSIQFDRTIEKAGGREQLKKLIGQDLFRLKCFINSFRKFDDWSIKRVDNLIEHVLGENKQAQNWVTSYKHFLQLQHEEVAAHKKVGTLENWMHTVLKMLNNKNITDKFIDEEIEKVYIVIATLLNSLLGNIKKEWDLEREVA